MYAYQFCHHILVKDLAVADSSNVSVFQTVITLRLESRVVLMEVSEIFPNYLFGHGIRSMD